MREEREYGAALVNTYKGFDITEHSFFDFFIETLHLAAEKAFFGQLSKSDKHYALLYLTYLYVFRGLRAASTLKNYGYPLRGFAALRDQKDRAIHIGATINGMTNILAIYGIDFADKPPRPLSREEYEAVRRRRSREQSRAMSLMLGRDSELDANDIAELERVRDLYHEEVHAGTFTVLHDFKTLFVDKTLPPIGPSPHHENLDMSSYMSRACEIGWMLLRSFPYLQLEEKAFGADWAERWQLLDDAFRVQVESIGEIGKPIGHVFSRMVDTKFAFDPEWHYTTPLPQHEA